MAKNGVQKSRRPKQWVREMLAELVGTYLLIVCKRFSFFFLFLVCLYSTNLYLFSG